MTEFKLPELGENVHQGDLVRLLVEPGTKVSEGQPVMELETDKAVVEVPSSVSGTVKDVLVRQGEKIQVGQVIFTVENGAGRKPAEASKPAAREPQRPAPPAPAETRPREAAPPPAATPAPPAGASQAHAAAPREFRLPELGENIHQGDLVRLMVSPGAQISEGQPVMELETDKAVVEVPSSVSGTVKDILVRQGEKIQVGQVIFTVENGARAKPAEATKPAAREPQRPAQPAPAETRPGEAAPPPAATPAPSAEVPQAHSAEEPDEHERMAFHAAMESEGRTEEQALPPDEPRAQPVQTFTMPLDLERSAGVDHHGPIPAAPHVRRLARELGVDIHAVRGTGPGGRISEDDVKAYTKGLVASFAAGTAPAAATRVRQSALPDFSKWGPIERVGMRAVRRKTAEHLWEAWTTIPHVTQNDKADITELEQLRARFAPKAAEVGGKMTVTAIALKVCASALKIFPQFNATLDVEKEEIIYKRFIHIGVAVDTDRGLLVPVIRDADKKNIVELAAELTTLSGKARDKKLSPGDMEGGTFTITNLGGIGGTGFSPIVNYPEVAILGLSRSTMEPVWMNGKFEPRMVLPLSLSYDHRLIDGADAARFLRWIAEAFEQPFLLSVQG